MDEEIIDARTPLLSASNGARTRFLCFNLSDKQLRTAQTVTGYTLIFLCGICFTAGNVIQRHLAPEVSHWHFLIYRAIAQIIVTSIDIQLNNVGFCALPRRQRLLIICGGSLTGLTLVCLFFSIKNVPLADATAILFTMPFFTFLLSICIFKERFGLYRLAVSAIMISGVVLIVRPPFIFPQEHKPYTNGSDASHSHRGIVSGKDQHVALGYACAVAAPLLAAITCTITKQICALRPSMLLLWMGLGILFVSLIGMAGTEAGSMFDYDLKQFLNIGATTVIGLFGMCIYILGIRWVNASRMNVFRTNEVAINCAVSLILEHVVFHLTMVAGILLLFLSISMVAIEANVMARYSNVIRFL